MVSPVPAPGRILIVSASEQAPLSSAMTRSRNGNVSTSGSEIVREAVSATMPTWASLLRH
ncbi:hypothetical protein D8770_00005 [Methylobacterium sp. DB1607]|nr:hypothetical protein [Methylobacterium sp. DB1607]